MKMRRSTLAAAVLYLPLTTTAVSFGTFQTIPSDLIPAACARAYNSEIPVCTANDFNAGCSSRCKRALEDKEEEVSAACSGLIVNSKSLLGLVQSGNVVSNLCVRDGNDLTTTTSARSFISIITSAPRPTTTRQPTPPILVAPSTTSQSNAITTTTRPVDTSIPSSTTLSDTIIVQPTTLPPGAGIIGDTPTGTSSFVVSTTTRAAVGAPVNGGGNRNSNNNGQNGSGGGSPFDIEGAGSSTSHNVVLGSLALAGWIIMLLGQ